MKYGFIIDNRKCIGCHACTVACKSEHDVPIGVNRTWVKQVEKGIFPNSRRVFSVLRCNHCTDAPCVEICPVQALYIRNDGIVDFNNDRCIGCKSCMQACPYDALYIDPETHTAAKCNYCAHRVDIGLEPACVNVCPEHAIISGDMENPNSEIAQTLSREQVTVRKPEKGTDPNVFYIEGDRSSLTPNATERTDQYIWCSPDHGVGPFSRFVEDLVSAKDVNSMEKQLSGSPLDPNQITYGSWQPRKSVEVLMEKGQSRRVYDTPDKGILWGWEVSAYVLTKAVAAGLILIPFIGQLLGISGIDASWQYFSGIAGLVFLLMTGILLVKDLDQPKRFLYVLLRPQWKSWLTRGGYAITFMGAFTTLWIVALFFSLDILAAIAQWIAAAFAIIVAIYTAFLFAQAKGRDFWQSPLLVFHMLVHTGMAGSAFLFMTVPSLYTDYNWYLFIWYILAGSMVVNLILIAIEMTITHPTQDAKKTVDMILHGRYRSRFWVGVVLMGNVVPLMGLIFLPTLGYFISGLVIFGIFVAEQIWVEAPQRIPLT